MYDVDMPEHGELVCLVTGATSGIGLAAATALARQGARVIVVGRTPERAAAAVKAIGSATGSDRLEAASANLSSQLEVRRLASHVLANHDRLDVLINNAGTIKRRRLLSADGIELTWAVNLLAPFLLTTLLLELLKRSAPARVVNVASHGHQNATIDFDDLMFLDRPYEMRVVYGQSKLALVMFTIELAGRLEGQGVTANSLHPGFIGSNFGKQVGGRGALTWRVIKPFLAPPEKGAETAIYLATSAQVDGVTGQYFVDGRPERHNPLADDHASRERLWDVASAMTSGSAAGQ